MTIKGTRRHFKPEFKKDAVALVSKQGYSIPKAAKAVGTTANNLRRWIKELKLEEGGVSWMPASVLNWIDCSAKSSSCVWRRKS
ncbi:transposase [Microbulbifer epialgicus]|uniref:Transposase n=1 Tax=Microbulbifer epialgicus TaxID=393907 RepID=A0ABV4P7U5_9GAMM